MKTRFLVAAAITLALVSVALRAADNGKAFEINVLSNRADLLSGGDALVEIVLPAGADVSALKVQLSTTGGARDVASAFAMRANGNVQGLLTGLPVGPSTLSASLTGRGSRTVRIALTNYPIGGPIFAGPQVQPWICQTEEAGLGPATDAQCNAPSKVEYFYKSTNPAPAGGNARGGGPPAFLPYNPASPPADVAMTTTDQGRTVPFIVRREMGTLDRAIYSFAVLFDPAQPSAVAPWQPPAAWNHKLYYPFGGGAAPGHRQAAPGSVLMELPLSRGFAVATTSLNTFGNNTNSVVSAETVMMLKELIVERFGEIRYTFATGGSGGAMQQHLLTNAYPGLLDGIQPSASFPDIYKNNREVQDCSLLLRYFKQTSPELWQSVEQRNAVMNNANELPGTCEAWVMGTLPANWGNPSVGCVPAGRGGGNPPPSWVYHPVTNPKGVRCTLQDYQVAMFGRRADGFANRPFDNVGVQYGLRALEAGTITVDQFIDMNEKVGGFDIDRKWSAARSVADPVALNVVHRTGQLNLGHGMNTVPVMDNRGCRNVEVHSCYHTWVMRARIAQTHGGAANHVVFLNPPSEAVSFDVIDRWVGAIKADTSNAPLAEKVVRHKPADAVDSCWINGQKSTDTEACLAANPYFGDAHLGAGNSIEDDVLKCQVKPLRRADYKVSFTDAQWARMEQTFTGGVCDWTKPSVGYIEAIPWLTFAGGPGGKPIGPAPKSK